MSLSLQDESSSGWIPGRRRGRKSACFSYPDLGGEPEESRHVGLSPYLFDAGGLADPHLTVRETSRPMNGLPKLIIGSKPIDGGHYIFTAQERDAFFSPWSRTPLLSCAPISVRANICKAADDGFSPCTTHHLRRWRGCRACGSASPPSASIGKPAKARPRKNWRKRRRSIT